MADGQIHFEKIVVTENTDDVVIDIDCGEGEKPDAGLNLCMERDALRNSGIDASKCTQLTLTLGETLTTATNTDQNGKLEVGAIQPGNDGDGVYFIWVSNKDNSNDLNENYFEGIVNAGESFSAVQCDVRVFVFVWSGRQ